MPPPTKTEDTKSEKKKSGLRTILQWTFDLTLVGLLICYFASAHNTESFWSTSSSWFTKAVAAVFQLVPRPASKNAIVAALKPSGQAKVLPPPVFIPPPLPTAEQLSQEAPGDCFPPEAHSKEDAAATARLFYQPQPLPKHIKERKVHGQPIQFAKKKVKGVPFYQVTADLTDPDFHLVIRLPNKADQANSTTFSAGHELFDTFVKSYPSAAMVNGTFFSKDDQERVMGNMVSEGKSLKYSEWENYGTTLSLGQENVPEMVTARVEGKPIWDGQWFSLTCGPRLLRQGEVWVYPEKEGFADPHVLQVGPRAAMGYPKSRDKLYLITFLQGLSLKQEAELMKAIGCYEAMNLDGGASKALAHGKTIVMKPGRGLTNVLVVYDSQHKAPDQVITAWQQYQQAPRE